MSDTVIRVENLSKKYIIGHQRAERYQTFRDNLAAGAMDFARRLRSPFTFNVSPLPETQEDFFALKDVSFEIKRGDRVGIIGRNGAGKSTLLKILSRITEPTAGRIEIDGRVASLLEVGTGFHPELTGRENIFLNGAILGMTRLEIKRKFDEIVAFAEIEKFLDTPVKRYSSGMYVRLAFAVAAHLEPEILIVDEVLAVGDAQFQKKCLGKMEEVGKEGRTVLFVSHNLGVLRNLCNQAVLLDKGKIVTSGLADAVVALYHSSMVTSGAVYEALQSEAQQPIFIERAEIRDLHGNQVDEIPCGEGFRVVFTVQCVGNARIDRPWIGVRIINASGDLVSHVANLEAGFGLTPITGRITLTCELPQPNLLPGDYRISFVLANTERSFYQTLENALSISIIPADVFCSGILQTSQHGQVFLSSKWSVIQSLSVDCIT